MTANRYPQLSPMLPWERSEEESRRFRNIIVIALLLSLIFGIVIPLIDVPEDSRYQNDVPERLVKLVLEQKKEIKPIPIPELPKEEKKEEEKKEEKKEEEKKKEEPKPEPKPVPEKKTAKEVAKEKAAVFDVFAELRDNDTVAELQDISELTTSGEQVTETKRNIIGNSALTDSGGINQSVASQSKGSGGTLKGSGTTAVTSKIEGVAKKTSSAGSTVGGLRSSENIQLVFGRSYDKIFRPYNRALRKNPSLQGTVVFHLRIEANGTVSKASIVRSELNDPNLEKRLLAVVKRLNFGALNVKVWESNYPVVFAPQ